MKEFGFVGCLINPDPSEATNYDTPGMGDEYWYPLYEKLVELDVPGYIHGAGCRSMRHSYSTHFINEETISVVSLVNSRVFQDFPKLKIVCSHGGGAVPYHFGRFLAPTLRRGATSNFCDNLRKLYYDTVLVYAARVRAFDQDGWRGSVRVWDGASGRRDGEGSGDREVDGRCESLY